MVALIGLMPIIAGAAERARAIRVARSAPLRLWRLAVELRHLVAHKASHDGLIYFTLIASAHDKQSMPS